MLQFLFSVPLKVQCVHFSAKALIRRVGQQQSCVAVLCVSFVGKKGNERLKRQLPHKSNDEMLFWNNRKTNLGTCTGHWSIAGSSATLPASRGSRKAMKSSSHWVGGEDKKNHLIILRDEKTQGQRGKVTHPRKCDTMLMVGQRWRPLWSGSYNWVFSFPPASQDPCLHSGIPRRPLCLLDQHEPCCFCRLFLGPTHPPRTTRCRLQSLSRWFSTFHDA